MSSHGLLHSDRHGDQGGCGFVTVLLSKSVTGETNVKPAEETLHVLYCICKPPEQCLEGTWLLAKMLVKPEES